MHHKYSLNQIFIQQSDLCGNNFKIATFLHIFSLLRNVVFIRAEYMQNSRNFEIIATEIELLNKHLI
jgi:hypothetical protein